MADLVDLVAIVAELYGSPSAERIYDESVSEREHALQCAALAVAADAPGPLVVAALLHDIGHLLECDDVRVGGMRTADQRHERIGARFLARWFGPEVTSPVALHVSAKRYLCASGQYARALSPASAHSLQLQGGAMSAAERAAFLGQTAAPDAVRLRRWDDEAKVVGLDVPGLTVYMPLIHDLARRHGRSSAG